MAGVCTLGDIQLFPRDVDLLRPSRWLNDQVIAYFFEHFTAKVMSPGLPVLLLEPSIIYTASFLQDAAALQEMMSVSTKKGVPPLTEQMRACELVLMPVNDKDDPDAHEGEHRLSC